MPASVTWDSLDDLKDALMHLPEELAGEASHIVEGVANAAAAEIRQTYPVFTGNLRDHVEVDTYDSGKYGVHARVRNTAKHAFIFENGTEARHYYTDNNVEHATGRMPPGHVFIPIMMKHRRRMYVLLAELLERHGITARIDDALAA